MQQLYSPVMYLNNFTNIKGNYKFWHSRVHSNKIEISLYSVKTGILSIKNIEIYLVE